MAQKLASHSNLSCCAFCAAANCLSVLSLRRNDRIYSPLPFLFAPGRFYFCFASCGVEAAKCGGCVGTAGCGYCLSTLRCVEGDAAGPSDGSPCPSWVHGDATSCPAVPSCAGHTSCAACAAVEDCAWCGSEKKCLTVSDVFSQDCRRTVYDPPRPATFVAVNRVVGNLVVERDAAFGGGHIQASGR